MAATLGLVAAGASADPIGYTLGIGAGTSQLQRIDLATLEVDPIGDPGGVGAEFLAFHADGTLYGLSRLEADSLRLVSFDLDTGVGNVVADLTPGFEFLLLGFTGDAHGNLWGSGVESMTDGGFRLVIFAIDAAGGSVGAPVEVLGLDPLGGLFGLAACGDLLLATASETGLVAVDPASGEARQVVEYPKSNRALTGITAGPDGALYVAEWA